MTIALAWVRQNKETKELIIATDSRLRSRGALDQAQKIFRLERGDCCLSFCGDAQLAYPLFVQVASFINGFIKSRTRAQDFTDVIGTIGRVLNNLVASWDLDAEEKAEELSYSKILLAGWSWKHNRFEIGSFEFIKNNFEFHRKKLALLHPWKEIKKSLVFIGDYESDYQKYLIKILEWRHGLQDKKLETKKEFNFDYEPIEALALMLRETQNKPEFSSIGGAPQMLKLYPYATDLPVVIRLHDGDHYLFGRKLFPWEKTNYPILTLSGSLPQFLYPLAAVPLPKDLSAAGADDEDHGGALN